MLYFPYKIKLYHAFQVCCVNPQTTPKTTANFRTGTINCEAAYGKTVKSQPDHSTVCSICGNTEKNKHIEPWNDLGWNGP